MIPSRSLLLAPCLGLTLLSAGCAEPKGNPSRPSVDNAALPSARPSEPGRPSGSDAGLPGPTPFVVAFVVDQLSAWVAAERFPLLPETGGFARLRREGTWAKAVRLPYAVTDTAPGHASLHTGKVPSESGIWGNEIPNEATGGRTTFLLDPTTRALGPDKALEAPGSSSARLRVENVADRLRKAHPDALTISLSLKDRGAIMPGGKHPTVALWFDASVGSFVTSTAFMKSFPAWAVPIANVEAVKKAQRTPWTLSDPAWVAKNSPTKDDAPGEGDLEGLGTTFPHVAKSSTGFKATPAADAMLFDLARAALAELYTPGRPTLLLMSMSTSDIAGHVFGPDSWEAWDHLYKLDAALGRFLDELEARYGDVSVILGADHGNSSMPEVVRALRPGACSGPNPPAPDAYDRSRCIVGTRIEPVELQRELRAETTRILGPGSWVAGVADPYVFLTSTARALDAAKMRDLDLAIRRVFARKKDSIAEIFDVRELARTCPTALAKARGIPERALPGEDTLTLVCRSWAPNMGAGDYYLVPKLGSYFDGEVVTGKGGSHGGPWLHDRTIPMLVRSHGVVDAGIEIADPVDFTAYSAILGTLLRLDPDATHTPNQILDSLRATPQAR